MDKQGAVDFQYKDVETISQDLYYMDNNNAIQKLGKDQLAALASEDPNRVYYKDSDGAVAGIQIGGSTASTYVASANVYTGAANTYYQSTAAGFVDVKVGASVDSAGTYYSISATADPTGEIETNATAIKGSDISATGTQYLIANGQTVYDSKTGDSLSANYNIGADSTVISNYYSEISKVALDVDDIVDYNDYIAKNKVQFVDKEGNEIAVSEATVTKLTIADTEYINKAPYYCRVII